MEYELAQKEEQIEVLNSQIIQLEREIDYLNQFQPGNSVQVPSEDEVISILKGKLDFYCSDITTRSFKVSSINGHTFDIRYRYKEDRTNFSQWISGIQRIEFLSDNKYRFEVRSGPICTGQFSGV